MITRTVSPPLALSTLALLSLLVTGCGQKSAPPTAEAPPPTEAAPAAAAAPSTPSEAIAAARTAMKAGKVDDAAAKLAQLQAQGATFDAAQAKDYRQALSEAYDRAMEAAQRGDPRAQTAIQLLRAAGPR